MFETLSETCGLTMFMVVPSFSAATLGRALAALAAVLPQEVGERAEGLVVGRVEERLPLAAGGHEPRVHHAVEVVIQRRPGNVELLLELRRRDPLGTGLHDRPQEGEPGHVAERGELVGMTLDGFHIYESRS